MEGVIQSENQGQCDIMIGTGKERGNMPDKRWVVAGEHLSQVKLEILELIHERNGITPMFLKWKLNCTATNISLHFAALEKSGFLNHDNYGKNRIYKLSDKGTRAIEEVKQILKDWRKSKVSKKNEEHDRLLSKERDDMQQR